MIGEGIPSIKKDTKKQTILSSGFGRYVCVYMLTSET